MRSLRAFSDFLPVHLGGFVPGGPISLVVFLFLKFFVFYSFGPSLVASLGSCRMGGFLLVGWSPVCGCGGCSGDFVRFVVCSCSFNCFARFVFRVLTVSCVSWFFARGGRLLSFLVSGVAKW